MATEKPTLTCEHCGTPIVTRQALRFCSYRCGNLARPRLSLADRFWAKVKRGRPDECWPWMAGTFGNGYGSIGVWRDGVKRHNPAHRVAWELTHGPIPHGLVICHRCDRPLCVNPAHLFAGTVADNIHDAIKKARNCRGERSHHAKLTEHAVREIRARHAAGGVSHVALSIEYGVQESAIRNVVTRETWKHV